MVHLDQKYRAHYEGSHNKNRQYNPFSLVLSDGGYYLAVSVVPEGIEITNDSYWMWYCSEKGDPALTARVAKNERDIAILSSTLSITGADLQALTGRVTNNEGNIAILSSTLTVAGSDITTLKNNVSIISSTLKVAGDDIDALKLRVKANEDNITSLQSAVDYIAGDIDKINTDNINFVKMLTGITD